MDYSNIFDSSSSTKNFDYTLLYEFLAKQLNIVVLDSVRKKQLRKKLQNYTPFELSKDTALINALIVSGFFEANKNKDKMKIFVPVIQKAIDSNNKAKK